MASSVKLYTLGAMKDADLDSATSEATGYLKENMIDMNPDTYWKGTSTATQSIEIDLNSTSIAIDGVFLFIRNYASITGSETCDCYWSDDDSSYTFVTASVTIASRTLPIYVRTFASALTHRYWRFNLASLTTVNIQAWV